MPKHIRKSVRSSPSTEAARSSRTREVIPTDEACLDALHREADHIKELLARNDTRNSTLKYEIAVRVKGVVDGKSTYGSSAVKKLGDILNLKTALLYRWAGVAGAWPNEAAFQLVTDRKNKLGFPLTWSHFELLANKAESDAARESLLEMSLAENLSVRELRERMQGQAKEPKMSSDEKAPSVSVKNPLVEISKDAERDAAALAHCRQVLKTKPVWSAEDAAAAEKAKARIEAMIEEGAATVVEIEERLAAARQSPPSAFAPAVAPAEVMIA